MKLRDLDLSDHPINAEHQALGLPPVEAHVSAAAASAAAELDQRVLRTALWSVVLLLAGVTIWLSTLLFFRQDGQTGLQVIAQALNNREFWTAVAVGLLAQTVDGALGMAYGITSTSFLLATGTSPAVASASVHIAEVFTTGVSGIAHIKFGNVRRDLFLRLLVPGMVGAVAGAYVVSSIDGKVLKPWISAYLFLMGLYVLSKIVRKVRARGQEPRHVAKLGLAGGFLDAVGGGGWGPVVTTTLVGTGQDPRMTIGSVNLAEFFLTFVSAGVFAMLVGESPWMTVAGLVIGGLFAAPLAAWLTHRLHTRTLLALVGGVIALISLFNLISALR
jgi:hypothetical protein